MTPERRRLLFGNQCHNTGHGVPERPCGFCHEGWCNAECDTCGEVEGVEGECANPKRVCGHHCNCMWTHDSCCWCAVRFCGDCEELHEPGAHTAPDLA